MPSGPAIVPAATSRPSRYSAAVWPGATPVGGVVEPTRSPQPVRAALPRRGRPRYRTRTSSGPSPRSPTTRAGASASRRVASASPRPDHHRVAGRVGREHVERLGAATPIPRRWPTVKRQWPGVGSEHPPGGVLDRPGGAPSGRALEEGPVPALSHEAHLLALDGVRGRQPGLSGHLPHARLRQTPERERQALAQRVVEHRQHVALVLARVGRARHTARPPGRAPGGRSGRWPARGRPAGPPRRRGPGSGRCRCRSRRGSGCGPPGSRR